MHASATVKEMLAPTPQKVKVVERIVGALGSAYSLVAHTAVFAGFFLLALLGILSWELMLLVLTTLVSLEAIYLALFIQITVNEHTRSLREVEEEIEELGEEMEDIQEDLDEISEDIEEMSEDMDEIQEDIEEMNEEELEERAQKALKKKKVTKAETLEQLTKDVQRVLADLEALKGSK